jgi:hypothetical protein
VCVFVRVPLQVTDVVELHARKGCNLHLSYLDLLCTAVARVGTLVDCVPDNPGAYDSMWSLCRRSSTTRLVYCMDDVASIVRCTSLSQIFPTPALTSPQSDRLSSSKANLSRLRRFVPNTMAALAQVPGDYLVARSVTALLSNLALERRNQPHLLTCVPTVLELIGGWRGGSAHLRLQRTAAEAEVTP